MTVIAVITLILWLENILTTWNAVCLIAVAALVSTGLRGLGWSRRGWPGGRGNRGQWGRRGWGGRRRWW